MTRRKRIALEILGPPLLGAGLILAGWGAVILWSISTQATPVKWDPQALAWVLVVIAYAYALAGIPSILYALVMEWRFSRGLNPAGWSAVGLSTFLGFLSGGAMITVFGGFHLGLALLAFWCGLGLSVGVLLGLLIKVRSSPHRAPAEACGLEAEG